MRLIFMYAAKIITFVAAMRTSNCSLEEVLLELLLEPQVSFLFL